MVKQTEILCRLNHDQLRWPSVKLSARSFSKEISSPLRSNDSPESLSSVFKLEYFSIESEERESYNSARIAREAMKGGE